MYMLHCTSKTNRKFHASYIYLNIMRKFQFSIQYKGNIIDTENSVIIEKHKEKEKSKNPLKSHHLKVNIFCIVFQSPLKTINSRHCVFQTSK